MLLLLVWSFGERIKVEVNILIDLQLDYVLTFRPLLNDFF